MDSMIGQEHTRAKNLKEFWDAHAALEEIKRLYHTSVQELRDAFTALGEGAHPLEQRLGASYPYIGITLNPQDLCPDSRLAFGAAENEGVYGTTITRPDLFGDYIVEQIKLLIENHNRPVYVGESDWPIPLPFAVDEATVPVGPEMIEQMRRGFVFPDLSRVDDNIANNHRGRLTNPLPLSFFSAERIDFSLHRLYHYTGTNPEHFQSFILLTNYQRYVKEFVEYAKAQLRASNEYEALVEPGDVITRISESGEHESVGQAPDHLPQMPAYHLKRPD
ncbi:MAG: AMP nucleosidase, partial [Holosporales bacterium]